MQQTDTGHYDVVQGEDVTLTITANKINEDVAVSLDGKTLPPTSSRPLVYNFPITKSKGAHFVDIECHFTATDPDDGYYQFSVQGSKGGGKFNASSIRKADSDWEAVLQFTLP
ncbi:MAG TPA: hypothetical protein VGQ12_00985 [Candidatus Angelobacter sp.]|jgi:hypothetical protein|nr:hypothetical protein [Candidatus Angelobacter sp.]